MSRQNYSMTQEYCLLCYKNWSLPLASDRYTSASQLCYANTNHWNWPSTERLKDRQPANALWSCPKELPLGLGCLRRTLLWDLIWAMGVALKVIPCLQRHGDCVAPRRVEAPRSMCEETIVHRRQSEHQHLANHGPHAAFWNQFSRLLGFESYGLTIVSEPIMYVDILTSNLHNLYKV